MKKYRMTHWNSSYYRRKNYNRAANPFRSIINDNPFLPVEPPVLTGLIRANIPGTVFSDEIKDFIAVSPALTFNFLNIAHSSFLKESRNIASLNDVMKMIGNDIVVNLLKDYVDRSCIMRKTSGIHPYTDDNFYIAIKAANLAALIADETDYSSHFNAYVAALLHNFGAVVLATRFPIQYSRICSSCSMDFSSHVQSEEDALGINHCFLGAGMVEGWDSFPFLPDALYYHHHPLNKIRQANSLVKLVYFSGMVASKDEEGRLRYLEAGNELFGFTPNQIDELISIADLKAQGRLMKLGIEPQLNKGEFIYQPKDTIDNIHLMETNRPSLISAMVDSIRKTVNKSDRLRLIGQAVHALTGINELLYFRYDLEGKNLEGVSLKDPENSFISNDLKISINDKESIIVTSFLMGMEINTFDRVENSDPDLFDIQVSNYMNSAGLYCIPIISMGRASGVLVSGVDNYHDTMKGEAGQRLKQLIEALLPGFIDDEIQIETGAGENKTGSDPMQMRKLIHEINNPLSAIKNFLKVLNMKLDDINVETNEIKIIDDELNRISKLLKEFRSSSLDESKEKSTSSIKDIISDTIMLIKNSRINEPAVNITVNADDNIPEIMIDRDAFRQVLINLVNNAIEAMPNGGNVTITVRYNHGFKTFSSKSGGQEADRNRLEISISDDGPGIPDNLKATVFKKQSTTKTDHDGLGLLIVYELVKRMGGTITFDNNSDRGACFKITMPVT
jgi:signal transduction histidine kinase/HD-like signal output (HDOD) protein